MNLSVRVLQGGERVPFLLGVDGVPLFYPTLFETAKLRNGGAAVNTIRNKLEDIEVLLRWEAANDRNLLTEFKSGQMLALADVVSLRDFCALDMRYVGKVASPPGAARNVTWLEARVTSVAPAPRVSQAQQYNRLSTIADYVEFTASVVTQHRGRPEDFTAIARMASQIRHHRPRGFAGFGDDDPNAKSPPPEVVDRFMAAMAVDNPQNPFRSPTLRLRNAIIFGLLRWTGMRRGELLSLRLDQLDLGEEPRVRVHRNQDDKADCRPHEPVTKTKERPLPIPEELAEQIQDYVLNVRAKIDSALKHPYLFVSQRKGPTYGHPLSLSALGSRIVPKARSVASEFAPIHPHAFRHHFNYELSVKIDAHNAEVRARPEDQTLKPISETEELDMRAFLNGHRSVASGQFYTRRHVREQADRAVRMVQLETTSATTTRQVDDESKG
ncbi:MAG TPA: site-specific integrase [Rhodanobacteraceae bacterium]